MNLQHVRCSALVIVRLIASSSSNAFSVNILRSHQLRSRRRNSTAPFTSCGKMEHNEINAPTLWSERTREGKSSETDRSLKEERKKNAAAPIRSRRPHNSYLKILMDHKIFEELHSLNQEIKVRWEQSEYDDDYDEFQALSAVISDAAFQPSIGTESNDETTSNRNKQTNSKPKLKIKTRSLSSLHMTYFFCGTMLNEMPEDQLELLNSMLREKLQTIDNSEGAYWLRFKSIDLFPPQRQNLIAAKFESSPALDELYEELCEIAMTPKIDNDNFSEDIGDRHPFTKEQKRYMFPLLRSAVFKQVKKRSQQQRRNNNTSSPWVAHVTLANIVGGKHSGIKQLSEWLGVQQFGHDGFLSSREDLNVHGLSLGGPHPEHVNLDWNYSFNHT